MIRDKKIIAIIPARGGSKGLPGKNMLELCGKPLVAWTIEQALGSCYIDKVIVSTDSPKIADIAKRYGAEAPFLRPKKLAQDKSPHSVVVLHALDFFEKKGLRFDFVALLEPTSPLRKTKDIDGGIEMLLQDPKAHTVVSVCHVEGQHPEYVFKIGSMGYIAKFVGGRIRLLRRQELTKLYFPEGCFYILRTASYRKFKSQYTPRTLAYPVYRYQSLEVDELADFLQIKALMEHILKGKEHELRSEK